MLHKGGIFFCTRIFKFGDFFCPQKSQRSLLDKKSFWKPLLSPRMLVKKNQPTYARHGRHIGYACCSRPCLPRAAQNICIPRVYTDVPAPVSSTVRALLAPSCRPSIIHSQEFVGPFFLPIRRSVGRSGPCLAEV